MPASSACRVLARTLWPAGFGVGAWLVVLMAAAERGIPPSVSAVTELPVAALRFWDRNPRRIRDDRLEDLKRALEAHTHMLQARPLLALPDGTVFAGNHRLQAAIELGWQTIPVITVDLDADAARVWALRDNQSYAEWDEPSLAALLADMQANGIELALTGFASADLDRILAGVHPPADPDDAPPLPTGEPDSKPGRIYALGRHRLLCGDCTDPAQVAALFDGLSAAAIWTDPPYGVAYTGKTMQALTIPNDDGGAGELLGRALEVCDSVLARSAPFYLAAPAGPQGTTFRVAIADAGWRLHQVLVWVKQSPVLGHSDYHYAHEDVLYGWTPGPGRPGRGRHRGCRWYGDNAQRSVFHVDRPARSVEHPTMKPVALIEAMLRNSSRRDDIVLDPFAGSGSTLIACEQLGRRCFAIELDTAYCDVIRQRYEAYRND